MCNGADGANGGDGADGADGRSALVDVAPIDEGDEDCPQGGLAIATGLDEDGDGVLDAAEIDSTQKVCDGVPGPEGTAGPQGPGGCSSSGSRSGGLLPLIALALLLRCRRR